MEVTIMELPAARVACHRHIGPYGPALGAFWRGTVMPWIAQHGLMERTSYGVGLDDPTITPPEKCRYDACVEVPDDFLLDGQAVVVVLPGGRYGVTRFKGPPGAIADAWMRLTREWLPASGFQPDERPCFERMTAASEFDAATGVFSCELCIPVRAL